MWEVARRHLRQQRAVERDLPAVGRAGPTMSFPLSVTQRRLWSMRRTLADRPLPYNITLPLRLIGPFDEAAFRRALLDVVNRHEALRTVFDDTDRSDGIGACGSQQVVPGYDELPGGYYSSRAGPADGQDQWLTTEASREFDLTSGPPIRVAIYRYRADECLMFLLAHHIILDGRSASVIFTELEDLYNAYLSGPPRTLAPPPRQHRDFVGWQAGWLNSPAAEAYLRYWRERLPPYRLAECVGPPSGDHAGGRVHRTVPPEVVARIGSLAAGEHVTNAAVYLAAFLPLLATGREVIVGIPAANRGRPELAGIVGFLVNVLPVVVVLGERSTFQQAALRIDEAIGGAYAHQAMPIEHVADLAAGRPCGTIPIDAFFVAYRQAMDSRLRMHGLRFGEEPEIAVKDAEFPVMLTVIERPVGATVMLSYQTSAYSPDEAAALADRYVDLLTEATSRPELPVGAARSVHTGWAATTRASLHRVVNAYDSVAESYDQTRGGETRGDLYAGELEPRLLPGADPVLEIGVGTGLVALGLQRRGRTVIGVDLSAGMLAKASGRLPGPLIQGDVCALPFRDSSLTNVISVWMIQAVSDPLALFREVFRVLRPGGRLLACPTNRPAFRDPIGVLLARMFVAIDKLTANQNGSAPPRPVVDASQILSWGQAAGFAGVTEQLPDERWSSDRDAEIKDIEERRWAPLVDLDDATYAAVTGPALTGLRELRAGPRQRRAVAHVVLLDKPGR